ncbi:MAG: trigger factor [Deltaproteobacteria bacterium]|nr:trigger factor [Deltaproteobacteria bacterium]
MAELVTAASEVRVEKNVVSPVVSEVSVEVPAGRVDEAFGRVLQELRKGARVKGFRPGKVPPHVIKQLYGPQLGEEVERVLVNQTLPDAVTQVGVVPVVEPQIEAEPPVAGQTFKYKARIEMKPEIELPDLASLSGSRPAVKVGQDEVLAELERLRERQAAWIEEADDALAAVGHQVTVDFVGTLDGVAFEGGTAEGVEIELGSGRMIPGFEEQLVGARSGEARTLNVTFPTPYGNAELAGKAADFAAKVTAIKRRELPALDDDFAKDLGDFETLDDVKRKLQESLEAQRRQASDHALERSLLDDLVARTRFEVPPTLVSRQLESQIQQLEQQLRGRLPENELRMRVAQLREEGWDDARRRVQEALLLESVASRATLEASEEEIHARLDEMAASQGFDAKLMHDLARAQGWHAAIAAEIVDRKALAHLIAQARIADVEA